jgi:hypothetical protein
MSNAFGTPPTPPADTAAPAALPPPEPFWAKPAISVFALGIFVVAYLIAFLSKDSQSLLLMSGAVIGMAQQVVGYWVGSSSGSTAKTAQIVAQAPKAPAP